MDDRMSGPLAHMRARPFRPLPRGVLDRQPPRQAGDDVLRLRALGQRHLQEEHERAAEPLGIGRVALGTHELGELGVADGGGTDAKCVERDRGVAPGKAAPLIVRGGNGKRLHRLSLPFIHGGVHPCQF
ncbi:MAG: hypothetical protein ABI156_12345, partial [Caldimonas sp.]